MLTLSAQKRGTLGKQVKHLRKEGLIPAELFGPKTENKHLAIPAKEFHKVFKEAGHNTVVELKIEGQKESTPIFIQEVQTHPLSGEPLHINCYHVHKDIRTHASVPLVFTGTAPAEKKECIVVQVTDKLEVEALPQDIPHEIKVDIGALKEEGDLSLIHI